MLTLKLLLAPHAYAAKWWSWANERARAPLPASPPTLPQLASSMTALLAAPYKEAWKAVRAIYKSLSSNTLSR
jgi:hypothetical protein